MKFVPKSGLKLRLEQEREAKRTGLETTLPLPEGFEDPKYGLGYQDLMLSTPDQDELEQTAPPMEEKKPAELALSGAIQGGLLQKGGAVCIGSIRSQGVSLLSNAVGSVDLLQKGLITIPVIKTPDGNFVMLEKGVLMPLEEFHNLMMGKVVNAYSMGASLGLNQHGLTMSVEEGAPVDRLLSAFGIPQRYK